MANIPSERFAVGEDLLAAADVNIAVDNVQDLLAADVDIAVDNNFEAIAPVRKKASTASSNAPIPSPLEPMIVTVSRRMRNATIKSMLMRGGGLEGGRRDERVTSRRSTMQGRTQKEKKEGGRGMI
jgi:hypothetical protein